MGGKLKGLGRSKSGIYRFRMRVPDDVQDVLGKTEEKKSLDTKDPSLAAKRYADKMAEFDYQVRAARRLKNSSTFASAVDKASILIEASGVSVAQANAVQIPGRKPGQSIEEHEDEVRAASLEEDIRQQLLDTLVEPHIDYEMLAQDWASGHTQTTPMKASLDQELYEAVKTKIYGEKRTLSPTLSDLLKLYLDVQRDKKSGRSERKTLKAENQAKRAIEVIGSLYGGSSTLLASLDRPKLRFQIKTPWPKPGTRNKYINILSAIVNTWNEENEAKVYNPFSGLSNKKAEEENATIRRSFKPDEWPLFVNPMALEASANGGKANQQIALIGLIMAYTGCRTEAASGLMVQDVYLDAAVPYITFRDNEIRKLYKDDLTRNVPLVPILHGFLATYVESHSPTHAMFPRYGTPQGANNASALLRSRLRKIFPNVGAELAPYSLRHSLHDMFRVAGVPLDHQHYLVGHKNHGSTRIHAKYGTGMPASFLYDDMINAFKQETWGEFNDQKNHPVASKS